ncbi:hypothetical protein L211DRAFT_833089 [Terfezia boudieri ATCC MYA-4762]|uniref:Uncharacterized protein n=1 Tax=Terfezia boudieri ATCC MYA-4762 TaxID=1051890 RepID=A0A3N4MMM5_9PEZI|nr:hypothetical protein L211DRAFT_833089 [Terfezia boudieri ATCC MYA-4762]
MSGTVSITGYERAVATYMTSYASRTAGAGAEVGDGDAGREVFREAAQEIVSENQIQFVTPNDFHRRFRKILKGRDNVTTRILITGVSKGVLDSIITNSKYRSSTRLCYENDLSSGILKLAPSLYHELTSWRFSLAIVMKVLAIPGHNEYSIDGLGATRFQVPGRQSKEGVESLRCRTRAGDDWPNVVMEIGVSERIIQLQRYARWWLESSALVIILHVTRDPHSLHIEVWRLQPNPNPRGRRPRAEIPMCINTIEIDAGGTHGKLNYPLQLLVR